MSVAYRSVGGTAVVVLGSAPPDEDGWSRLVDWLDERPTRGSLDLLVVSHGGSPDAAQRRILVERVLTGREARAAFVTTSGEVRGAAAAMSWFLESPLESFLPTEAERAMAFVGVFDAERVRESIAALEEELGVARSLLTPSGGASDGSARVLAPES